MNGALCALLGIFTIFSFTSAIDKAGSDPSAGLIVLISTPMIVLGAIFAVVGIVMLLFSFGSDDNASVEQNIETRDSDIESPEEGRQPDHKSADLSAREFVKETASWAVGRLVAWVVMVALLLLIASALLSGG